MNAAELEPLAQVSGLGEEGARKLKHRTKVYLGELPPDAEEPA